MQKIYAAALLLAANVAALAQNDALQPAYDFSLPREDRIKLAESAAPPEVSGKATVYVLERSGYAKVRDRTNGFSCLVDRNTPWSSEPACFDPEGSATTVPTRLFAEEQRAKGKTEDQINQELDNGYRSGRFKAPRKPGIVYMMSDSVFIFAGGKVVHGPPHLMFYAPYATDPDLGSPPRGMNMPFLIRPGQPDTYMIVIPGPGKHSDH